MDTNEELEKKVEQVEHEDQHADKSKKKKGALKYVAYLVFVLAVTAGSIVITLYQNFNEIIHQLATCNWWWLLLVFGTMAACVAIRSFILFCFARLYTRDYHFYRAVAVDQIGVFYNAVTPTSSGGQVMQAYTYKKQGIPLSSAVSVLAMYSILFQLVLIFYGVLAFIVKYDAINSIGSIRFQIADWAFALPIWPLTIIGFLLNVSIISIVLLMGYWKGFHNFIMGPVISFLAKIRLVKNPDKKRESLRVQVENFKIEMRRLFSNIPFTILIVVSFFILMTLKDAIPYFVGLSLGNLSTSANYWDAVFLSNYHQMVTGLIPTPGSAGVSEYFFARLFVASGPTAENSFYFNEGTPEAIYEIYKNGGADMTMQQAIAKANSVASNSLASAALLIWRSITFIIPVFISGLVTAFYRASPKDEISEVPNRETFVTLQSQTLVERAENMETMLETSKLKREEIMRVLSSTSKIKKKTARRGSKVKHTYDDVNIDHEDDSL
ncbi:MAG TPA: lysylphosphatidylglycerol synthase transmembrane domain-containing protein [Bacilli bacterium]|nr:lysylphosphatidylglycerol synthase transmembrane domain-containing protein [Bacilli bacterium]HPS18572.1 lysylphosphatidylglycerol synthase transmembrane domain-containing protein [Bacilli bacterium]